MRSVKNEVRDIWNESASEGYTVVPRAILRAFSLPYAAAVALRNRLYDRQFFRPVKLPRPVISVGNLTVGGTGKTPTVILIAALLKAHGYHPAVLSRGYGGDVDTPVNIVSDGDRVCMGWREAGDEPVMIARALPGVPVLTGPKRSLTGRAAVERFGADVLILDDGFQHRSVSREIDIVLLDAARPFGNGHLLPRGPLREPPKALRRATVLLRTGDADHEAPLREASSLPSFRGIHRPLELVDAATEKTSPLAKLRGAKVLAFAGIGSPDSFQRSLEGLGAEVVCFRAFPDHHPYRHSDIVALRLRAADSGAALIVTTEKDTIRLADFPDFLAEISFLRIGMEIASAESFKGLILSRVAGYKS